MGIYMAPAAQIVKAISHGKFGDDDYFDFMIFYPLSALDTLLQSNFSSRTLETSSPLEKCTFLIALQINQESHWHTLKMYVLIQHPDLLECLFY